jgi:hypothetical protein
MDDLVEAYENPTDHQVPASFRLVAKVNQLIELVQGAEGGDQVAEDAPKSAASSERAKRVEQFRQRRAQSNLLFREALAEGDDEIRLEGRPTENGMRLRVRLDEGFIRGLGRVIATRSGLE